MSLKIGFVSKLLLYLLFVIAALVFTSGNALAVGVALLLFNVMLSGLFSFGIISNVKSYARIYAAFSSSAALICIFYGLFQYREGIRSEDYVLVICSVIVGTVLSGFMSKFLFEFYWERESHR